MDPIHHHSVIAIKFTVCTIFSYMGCAAFLEVSIINQKGKRKEKKRLSLSRGFNGVYLGHTAGRTTQLQVFTGKRASCVKLPSALVEIFNYIWEPIWC